MRQFWQKNYRFISIIIFIILSLILVKNLVLNLLAYNKIRIEKSPQPTPIYSPQIMPGIRIQ